MPQANAMLGLIAETAIHAGAGQALGAIDLPIQREAHSGWPCVYGSAVKGALRTRAEDLQKEGIDIIFGPDTTNAFAHAGALAVGDARLLLLPVRSLTTHFKWVTCPALLARFKRDAERLGFDPSFAAPTDPADETEALVPQAGEGPLFLEEYRFAPRKADLNGCIEALAGLIARDGIENDLRGQLVVVANDMFNALAHSATPVAPHVKIDNGTKTVQTGGLWYEETLAPETVLYVALNAWDARNQDPRNGRASMSAEAVLDGITNGLFGERAYLQIGGNETVGMGWCKVAVAKGGA